MNLSVHQAVRLPRILSSHSVLGATLSSSQMPQHEKLPGEDEAPVSPFRDLTVFRVSYLSWRNATALPSRLRTVNSLLQRILEFLVFSLYKW